MRRLSQNKVGVSPLIDSMTESHTKTNVVNRIVTISTTGILIDDNKNENLVALKSFADKMLAENTPIDEEIQEVINDHFWDML